MDQQLDGAGDHHDDNSCASNLDPAAISDDGSAHPYQQVADDILAAAAAAGCPLEADRVWDFVEETSAAAGAGLSAVCTWAVLLLSAVCPATTCCAQQAPSVDPVPVPAVLHDTELQTGSLVIWDLITQLWQLCCCTSMLMSGGASCCTQPCICGQRKEILLCACQVQRGHTTCCGGYLHGKCVVFCQVVCS